METAQTTTENIEVQKNVPTPWRHLFPVTGTGEDDKLIVKITPTLKLEAKILEMGIDKILFLWGGNEYLADYKITKEHKIII
jgi:hypothetical protein